MTTANKITTLRVVLIPVMFALYYLTGEYGGVIASIVFIVASVTDFFDGMVARRKNETSDFGKLFDPLVDKLLACAALIMLLDTVAIYPVLGAVCAALLLLREFSVDLVRQYVLVKGGKAMGAGWLGKLKTLAITVSLAILLFVSPMGEVLLGKDFCDNLRTAGIAVLCIAVVLSWLSFLVYVQKVTGAVKNAQRQAIPAVPAAEEIRQLPPSVKPKHNAEVMSARVNLLGNTQGQILSRDMFDLMMLYCLQTGQVLVSKIKDKFQVGYQTAADAVEHMEKLGYVSKLTPSSSRRLLVTLEEYQHIMASEKN